MKRPEYVATVVRIYRKALDDLALKNRQGLTDQDRYELTQIFNRDFTTGYFHGYQGAEMMSFARPNNRGAKAGRILEVRPNRLTLKLESGLNIGDGLDLDQPRAGRDYRRQDF
jgi:putative protease